MKPNFNKNNNKNKPTLVSLPLVFTGVDKNGRNYNADSCKKIISELQRDDVFKKLSVSAGIQRSLVENDAKGTLTITRIQSIDTDTWDVSLMLFGQHTEYADKIKDFVVIPHVRTGRDSDEVTAILRFEIVEPVFTTVSVDA